MITRKDVMPINYYKKEAFTGSYQGMRYMIRKHEDDEGAKLEVIVWPQPFCFEKTDEDKKIHALFSFDEEGILEAVDWMNDIHSDKKEIFLESMTNRS